MGWLRVKDDQLSGDTFKFGDFFSTLSEFSVSSIDVLKADISDLALGALGRRASLPELQISLDDLLQSFPHQATAGEFSSASRMRAHKMESGRVKIGRASIEDILGSIDGLTEQMESVAVDLAGQRRLLEQLLGAR